ncbi:MAG: ABC transporter permease [Dehalococcoidia bacterium]|jgi:peptide/nickel transport system permease protein|nr:ABC transporter permease [Dehalococcoidia bacterium]HIB12515.1 ABC transporter permease [Dehalococcoidia bacterium]
MTRFIIRRVAYMILTMVVATLLVFSLSRVVGDPRLLYVQEGGYGLSPEAWDALGVKLHLDKPVAVQYLYWLRDAVQLDLGDSMLDRKPVSEILYDALGPTLQLAFFGWIFATAVGIPLGVLSAVKRGSVWDYLGRGIALLGQTLPVFWVGIMGILIFAVQLRWLPVGTMPDEFSFKHFIMPAITLGWFSAAGYLRLTRSAMLDVMDSEYIKLARAKGVNSTMVLWKHAFRNAIIAPLTFSSLVLAGFITGAIVTETVFSWPGLGRLAFTAVDDNDFPLIVGLMLLFTFMFLVVNLITDILYAYVDPRIRYG